ncbi:carboxymuconolactone decarboxylase family protein [Planctomycetota bacterium]
MDKKKEEMIAIGVAYGINCLPCMEYHKKKGIEAGLTNEQMQAAIRIAVQVKNGAAKKTRGYAEELFGKIVEEGSCPVGK